LCMVSSGRITSPSLSEFGGSYPRGLQTCPFPVAVCSLAESLGFEAPRTRLHPLLSATTKVALPRDHERGREEVVFAGRAVRCHVRRCYPRSVDIIYRRR
jgi:hypothetical protein